MSTNTYLVYDKISKEVFGKFGFAMELPTGYNRGFYDNGGYMDYDSNRFGIYQLTNEQMKLFDNTKHYILTSDFELEETDGLPIDEFDNVF